MNSNTGNDPDLEASAINWFLIRTGEEIIHTAGRFYAPGTVVNSKRVAEADVFICRRPTTDAPGNQDADWFHLPRGALLLEAVTTAGTYRSGTIVTIGDDAYFCHTSVVLPGITAAQIPAHANFSWLSAPRGLDAVTTLNSLSGTGTSFDPLDLNVAGSSFPIITIAKGGTGAATAGDARTSLGLGTAAIVDTGIASGEIPLLGTGGLLDAGRLATSGVIGQALLRTATGQEWGDVAAGVAGSLQFSPLGNYQFTADIDSTQDNQLFDAGFSAPPNSNAVFRLLMGDGNGRAGSALIRGSEIAGLDRVAAPVWADITTVGVAETLNNSRVFPYGSNRGLFLGITTGGNLAVGSTHDGVRPYVTVFEVVGGGVGGGTQHYYPIPDTGVGGTGDAVTLSTGETLSSYTNGLMVYFNSTDANTGAVTLAVDGLAAIPLRGSNGRGSATDLPARAITGSDPVLAVYDSAFNEFNFIPGHQGTAAQRNIGIFEFDVPELGTNGLLPVSTLAPSGTVGQALLRTAAGQEWGDVSGGAGRNHWRDRITFGGLWTNLQVRATTIQVPADARYIAAVLQMTGRSLLDHGFAVYVDAGLRRRPLQALHSHRGRGQSAGHRRQLLWCGRRWSAERHSVREGHVRRQRSDWHRGHDRDSGARPLDSRAVHHRSVWRHRQQLR